jgi:hypothetical protein
VFTDGGVTVAGRATTTADGESGVKWGRDHRYLPGDHYDIQPQVCALDVSLLPED